MVPTGLQVTDGDPLTSDLPLFLGSALLPAIPAVFHHPRPPPCWSLIVLTAHRSALSTRTWHEPILAEMTQVDSLARGPGASSPNGLCHCHGSLARAFGGG